MFIGAQFTISKLSKQCIHTSTDGWTKKYNTNTIKYYSTMKKNKFESFVKKYMHLETIILRETNHTTCFLLHKKHII